MEPKYEFINWLYEETSGYVHFSIHHLVKVVDDWDSAGRKDDDKLQFGEVDKLPIWRERHIEEALVYFGRATTFLLDEVAELLEKQEKMFQP